MQFSKAGQSLTVDDKEREAAAAERDRRERERSAERRRDQAARIEVQKAAERATWLFVEYPFHFFAFGTGLNAGCLESQTGEHADIVCCVTQQTLSVV